MARNWSGGYFSNDFQSVTDADARELGAALERAIEQFPSGPEGPPPGPFVSVPGEPFNMKCYGEWLLAADAWLGASRQGKDLLEEVLGLCRRGGFTIA